MSLESVIQTLGLPGLTLGAVLEGETVAFLGGVLAHRHVYPFEAAVMAISLGAVIVDNLIFLIGRRARDNAFVERNLNRDAAQRFKAFFLRNQVLAVLVFRFLYGLKTAGAIAIGTTGISWARFAILDLIAVLLWSHVVVGLGYAASTAITAAFGDLKLHWHLAVALAIFLAVGAVYWWFARGRKALAKG